jgi:hypothetical protein
MTQADEPRRESMIGLARRLAGGLVQLARLEMTRGRQEIGEMLAETKTGAILFGVAAGMGLLALITVDVALVLGVVALFEVIPGIAAAIIVVATFVVVAIGFALAGVASAGVAIGLLIVAAIFAVPAYFGFNAGWFAALYVLALQVTLAALFGMWGTRHVRIGPPQETIDAVKEDVAWAKRLLRRG